MIYDCFLFFNELDVLDIRLHELTGVVDRFVLVESTHTFTGIEKPLYYEQNKDRFSEFSDRIVHIVFANPVFGEGQQWERQAAQRNAIARGLTGCGPDDLVLISDVDEIPKASVLRANLSPTTVYAFELYHTSSYLDLVGGRWLNGTRMVKFGMMTESPQNTRFQPGEILRQAGWHFGYLGDPTSTIRKLQSISETSFNCHPYTDPEYQAQCRAEGRDVFGNLAVGRLPMDYLPAYVQQNPGKFDNLFFKGDLPVVYDDQITHYT